MSEKSSPPNLSSEAGNALIPLNSLLLSHRVTCTKLYLRFTFYIFFMSPGVCLCVELFVFFFSGWQQRHWRGQHYRLQTNQSVWPQRKYPHVPWTPPNTISKNVCQVFSDFFFVLFTELKLIVFPLFFQVKLYKSDNLDNPINSVSLGQSLFFHFPPLDRDGEVSAENSVPGFKITVLSKNYQHFLLWSSTLWSSTLSSTLFNYFVSF